jgi:hypothetical protein
LSTPETSRSEAAKKYRGAIVSGVTSRRPYRPADAESNIAQEGNVRPARFRTAPR